MRIQQVLTGDNVDLAVESQSFVDYLLRTRDGRESTVGGSDFKIPQQMARFGYNADTLTSHSHHNFNSFAFSQNRT
ncbi:hypothetical protein G6F37_009460 [Rhizopus arrhizus]|nr:hypothetical protein G6F38_009247 [Rhizopus arrhizus]KAG1154429.1 hypothetical protein G6F37_009460 [Rhizopus arrhizus]